MPDIKAVVGHFLDARGQRAGGRDDLLDAVRALLREGFPRSVALPEDGRTRASGSSQKEDGTLRDSLAVLEYATSIKFVQKLHRDVRFLDR